MRPLLLRCSLVVAAILASAPALVSDAHAKPKAAEAVQGKGKRAKASAGGERERAASDKPSKRKGALSSGSPNRGKLEGGVRLKPSAHVKLREGARSWGLPALVKAIHRAGDRVASKHSGSILLVGDLSGKRGGKIDGHNSHQSGRDADIGFFIANSKGKPVSVTRFVAFDSEGRAKEPSWARFDDARNWMLVEELLKDERAGVRYIFVANPLRARLLKYAASKKVPKEMIDRAAAAMLSPDGVDVHDDHFHVRIACPESMRSECVEESGARDRAPSGVADASPYATGTPSAAERPPADASGDTSRPNAGDDPY